jgi:dinuclear metal center YbgI/SA1388 family protein
MHLASVLNALQEIAPLEFAESWDNVGLLVGNRSRNVARVMTCLTLTPTTLQEAIDSNVELIVCHHPIPFKPLAKITDDTTTGKILLRAIEAGIAIYSPHTAWDNARTGINQQIAETLGLEAIKPLQGFTQGSTSTTSDESLGVGRYGRLPKSSTIESVLERIRVAIPISQVRHTHETNHLLSKIGIVCGSGGSMLALVARRGCDAILTGEATYHQCLEAESLGIAMLMIGHHASESFAMKELAKQLQAALPDVQVTTSQLEMSRF